MGNSYSSPSSSAFKRDGRKCQSLPCSPDIRRQLPVPQKNGNGTAIPLPSTVVVTRRSTEKTTRGIPVLNGQGLIKYPSGTPSSENSRPNSPPDSNRGSGIRYQPNSKLPPSPYNISSSHECTSNAENIQATTTQQQPAAKHSMLDKLKLFNKDKDRSKSSKRTSSSSGFSSARSDSSLSLNNDPSTSAISIAPSKNKKNDAVNGTHKPSSSSTPMSSSKTPKNLTNSSSKACLPAPAIKSQSKSEKKKSENNLEQQQSAVKFQQKVPNAKFQPPPTLQQQQQFSQQQFLSQQIDPRMKQQQPVFRKIEIRTDMKMPMPHVQAKVIIQPVTSIPKPMAAIKGTSKAQSKANENFDGVIKLDKSMIGSNMSLNGGEQKTQVVNPLSMSPQHNQLRSLQNGLTHASLQSMNDSIHSASTNNHSNSSDSSVIYRPGTSESGSEFYHSNISSLQQQQQYRNPIPNRKVDHFNDALLTNGHKFNTIPTKLNCAPTTASSIGNNQMGPAVLLEEQQKASQHGTTTVVPLRSIMRNYNNQQQQQQQHIATLPTRGARGGQNLVNGYYDEHHNQGYCSDGDALRKLPIRYSDIENGYLSEGGNGGVTNPHFMSIFRNRPQLPTTITEERCRSASNGNFEEGSEMDMIAQNWSQRMGENLKDKSALKIKSRVKGVPQNFGYVKKSNGSATAAEVSTSALMNGSRTAAVTAVPRTNKLKISGGTQTTNNDLQQKTIQLKSYSLTGPGAAQLSQSVKDRFASGSNSLPKSSLDMHAFHARISSRASSKAINDGSLSDTYSDIKDYSSYAMWLRHSNTSSRLSDGCGSESLEGSMSMAARNQRFLQHRNSTQSPAHKLNRSNSIRSTKSEKTYPSMFSRMAATDIETEPYYCLPVNGGNGAAWSSQPTSPTPRNLTGLIISPTHSNSPHRLIYHGKKNDEAHGSQISLMSGGSSMYGSCTEEQRQANEVRRLKRELIEAREQVMSLSSQLSTNAHVVNAFEKSLSTMTNRLQLLTATTEKKESEVTEMRQTIELLKKQSIQAGLTSAHIESMGVKMNVNGNAEGSPNKKSINGSHESGLIQKQSNGNGSMQRQLSTDSVSSINSLSSNCSMQDKKKKKGWLRSSFTKAFTRNAKISKTNQQRLGMNGNLSDSKTSLPQLTTSPQKIPQKMPSNVDLSSKPPISPTKMSNNSRQVTLIENARPFDSIDIECHPIVEDLKKQLREKDMVLTDIRLEALTQASQMETLKEAVKAMRQEMMSLKHNNERLQKIVTTRSLAGSENSLGCPASPCSAGGGDSRRYSFTTDSGHSNSRPPLDLPDNLDETEEEDEIPTPGPAPLSPHLISELSSPTLDRISLSNEILMNAAEEMNDCADGKKISIAVFLHQVDIFSKYMEKITECCNEDGLQINGGNNLKVNLSRDYDDELNSSEMIIAHTYISGKTTWQNLDYIVRKSFKDYLNRIDPQTNLGLNTDSIISYHLGDAKRGPEMGFPEFLPCGYIILNVKTLYICLQGVGSLAFDTLIPRSIVHRYINLLTEHRRLILCGPRGTGKTHLARKLGEYLVAKANRSSTAESIATFNVDHKSSKELQQYLSHIAEQASMNVSLEELPAVIILDNLHQASELGDVFSCLLSAGSVKKLPYIICTMSQATCNTSNLQLHHNFRWVLTANHIEPVKGFLGRFLRRRLFEMESQSGTSQIQMEKILRWLPTVVQHINSFLESHSSSDVTIGPNLFLDCPLDVKESQKWFLDLWNENLALYMVEAIKEGIQLYGKRGSLWVDPCLYIRETYPWTVTPTNVPNLRSIAATDVGLLDDADLSNNNREDPLLNMLNQLKEAASWNETQQDDSDCLSLDSNFTHDSSVENN